jgi:hypothetical protein
MPRRRLAVAAATSLVLGLAVVAAGLIEGQPSTAEGPISPPPAQAAPPDPGITADNGTTVTNPPDLLQPTGQSGDSLSFTVPQPFTLDLAAGETTWVRVTTQSGLVLIDGMVEAGATEQLALNEPASLRIGNAAGILIAAHGQLLDHPRSPQPVTIELS